MTDVKQYIYIGKPYFEKDISEVRLCALLRFHSQECVAWFSVSEQYGAYLVSDRADAFLVAVLTTALREGMDIDCEAPVTRRLLYQLNHYLIPMMAGNMEEYHLIKIYAEVTDTSLQCAGAVGTGWTGGVDSMYTFMKTWKTNRKKHQLTHLLIFNNGALEGDHSAEILQQLVKKAKEGTALESGLQVLGVDTNLQKLFPEKFLAVVSFRHAAVVLALQKLFGVFLSSAAYEFSRFAFDADNGTYYELVSLGCFETDCTVFYSAYGAVSRIQKLKELSDFPMAQKYLHPCIYTLGSNCGRCGKCIRTEVALYGLGTLDKFSKLFDIEAFEKNKEWYLANVLAKKESQHYGEAWHLLEEQGIKPSPNVIRMARILRAVEAVAKDHREWVREN